jgi:hypothetical protein
MSSVCLKTAGEWLRRAGKRLFKYVVRKVGIAAIILCDGIVAIKRLLSTAHHISAASQLGSSCEESIQCTKLGEPVTCDEGKCSCLRDALIIGGTCHKKKCEYIQMANIRNCLKYVNVPSYIILRPQNVFSRIDPLHISP